jgi:hypothetical protein
MPLALTLAALLCSSLPAFAQQSELDQLKQEVEKLKSESALKAARIQALEALLKSKSTPMERAQLEMAEQALLAETMARAKGPEVLKNGQGKLVSPPAPATPLVVKAVVMEAPKALEGRVTAVANEIGLVVLSIGSDDGVKEGDEFAVLRSGDFVAKIKIDRTDRKWCAGKVVLKKDDPRVMDTVSNHLVVSGARSYGLYEGVLGPAPAPGLKVLSPGSSDELKALRKELDEVRVQVRELSDHLIPSWQDAGVSVDEASEELRSHLGIPRGLVIRRVREGSAAEKAGLKANDVVPSTTEAQLLDQIARRLSVTVIRKGQQTVVAPK